ncbi:FTR1 family protein [Candidatus Woesearchaeota archaeon]|nr:FTR1 family protein [Candidatus Woesearchaeota archaeon]
MIENFLITSRETLEASLVIGIILAYLQRTDKESYKKTVWMGVAFGLGLSVLTAILFNVFAGGFEGRAEALFEGVTMLIGVALLTTMILWMMRQRRIAEHIHSKVDTHLAKDAIFSHLGLFFLAMIAVLREGVETVIFLNAVRYSSGLSLIGGLLGVAVAIGLGWLFFYESRKINLKKLFTFSSVLLILFAAGLVAHGVHELEEAKVLDPLISPLYSINGVVNENSVLGSFLKGLFGYNGNPSLLEALSYWVYLGAVGVMWKRASTA